MENDLAVLSLNDEENKILQISTDPLVQEEDPLKVPLIHTPFWVQIHDVPVDLFSENLAVQLGNFLGEFLKYDGSSIGKQNQNDMRVRTKLDIRRPSKRKKQIMFNGRCSYVMFKNERLSLFYFYCGRLGYNNSFCDAKMMLGVEVTNMGWDLPLRSQSRRVLLINSIWLKEEGERNNRGQWNGSKVLRDRSWKERTVGKCGIKIDPILGFNLEGKMPLLDQSRRYVGMDQSQFSMEHDLEDSVIIGEEGKKRSRGVIEETSSRRGEYSSE
ncbi:hypothetical protein GOBAR_AA02185 [Gossypium barbadense]|uniref:Zinc knuckle CX2CX4HX4C domain-containing protein n=1 Tax=Gossypium barbadense TaxID=3634 RepID=A0A2P5YS23_GOSBA|nr:hypothetical protein GOBAR_AA02185 [Gossypium barbadense]